MDESYKGLIGIENYELLHNAIIKGSVVEGSSAGASSVSGDGATASKEAEIFTLDGYYDVENPGSGDYIIVKNNINTELKINQRSIYFEGVIVGSVGENSIIILLPSLENKIGKALYSSLNGKKVEGNSIY